MELSKRRRRSASDQLAIRAIRWARLRDYSGFSAAEYALVLAIVGSAIAIASIFLASSIVPTGRNVAVPANASVSLDPEVRSGTGAFIKPAPMDVGHWYPIEFVAGPSIAALSDEAEESPLTPARPIVVSKLMRVTLLRDPNFEIRPKAKALQETGADLAATWQWDVKPQSEGTHTLIAQVDVLKRNADGSYQVFNRYSRRVSVRVGVGTVQGALNGIRNAESIGDALTALFKSWGATLVALTLLIAAAFSVRSGARRFRERQQRQLKKPRDAQLEPASRDGGK